MSIYKVPIELAIIVFPVVAFFFTLPYLIYQYRKYGAIPMIRSIILYSFILYLISAYFLVILPLPSMESVKKLTMPTMQLRPFSFIAEIIASTNFNFTDVNSILKVFKNPNVYVVLFNLCLTLPFGFYLKYYFRCKWYQVILYSFLLSLFFELTQLSGLYGIYPRPYRLFDVDDLILNTIGGLVGYSLTPIALLILPSRQELDEKSYEKGKQVSLFRRLISYCIDLFFLAIMIIVVKIMSYNIVYSEYTLVISLLLYYLVIPTITKGQTIGKMILRIKISSTKKEETSRWQIVSRCFLAYLLFFYQFAIIDALKPLANHSNSWIAGTTHALFLGLYIFKWLNILSILLALFKKEKVFLYERLTNTKNVSLIRYEKQEEKTSTEEKTYPEENSIRKEDEKTNVRNQENK